MPSPLRGNNNSRAENRDQLRFKENPGQPGQPSRQRGFRGLRFEVTHDHRAASGETQRPLQEHAQWSLGWTQTNSDILTKNHGMERPLHTTMGSIAGGISFPVGCCRARLQADQQGITGQSW